MRQAPHSTVPEHLAANFSSDSVVMLTKATLHVVRCSGSAYRTAAHSVSDPLGVWRREGALSVRASALRRLQVPRCRGSPSETTVAVTCLPFPAAYLHEAELSSYTYFARIE